MKNLLTLLFSMLCIYTFGQSKLPTDTKQKDKWERHTSPSQDNSYYTHFKSHLSQKAIASEKVKKSLRKITVSFSLNNNYDLINLRTNATSKLLKEELLDAFLKLRVKDLIINETSAFHNYSLQVLEKGKKGFVLNCSSTLLHETPPLMEYCVKSSNYKDRRECLFLCLEEIVYTELDAYYKKLSAIPKREKATVKLQITKTGTLQIDALNTKNSELAQAIKAILLKDSSRFRPATMNGQKDNYQLAFTIDTQYLGKTLKLNPYTDASSENFFSTYFKNNISQDLVDAEPLSYKHNRVMLRLSFDEQGGISNISTTAKNKELGKEIRDAVKKLPVDSMRISKLNPLAQYSLQVLSRNNFTNNIQCNPLFLEEMFPVIKGCEKSISHKKLRNCFSEQINDNVKRNFNTNIAKGTGLKGMQRIFVMFKIDKTGKFIDIRAKGPHPNLEEEAIRVIKKLKKNVIPGMQNGKAVGVKYSLPIVFVVTDR